MMRIALIGLGEVGRVLAEHLRGHQITAWDIAFGDPDSRAAANAKELPVRAAADAADAVTGTDLVFSAVTAANDLHAAREAAAAIAVGCWYVDLNSASPAQKQASAALVEGRGGRYVEAAVMSPIHPKGVAAPILLGGPTEEMTDWDFLSRRRVRIAVQGHAPIAAATQAVFETLKAVREGAAPKQLKGLASPDLMSRVTREAASRQQGANFLGLGK